MLKIIALYTRISADDENIGESDSIRNQRNLLNKYISEKEEFANYEIAEFSDDGYSGTNFERPSIKKLLELVKDNKVSCIIVKDFSRFGRNYIDVSDYLQVIFPLLGVRFISINDNFDSMINDFDTFTAFKQLSNNFYSWDISQKIRSAKTIKMKKGEYISAFAIYGYEKSKADKHKLVIDEYAAKIVTDIFEMFLNGYTMHKIVQFLNKSKIRTPRAYKIKVNNSEKLDCWSGSTVRRILTDERYTGKVIQGKQKRVEVGNPKVLDIPKENWYIVENMHPAIISQQMFNEVQEKFLKFKSTGKRNKTTPSLPVYCNGCDRKMSKNRNKEIGFFCKTHRVIETPNCVKGAISKKNIEEILISYINENFQGNNKTALIAEQPKYFCNISSLQKEIEALKRKQMTLYEKYCDHEISKEDFMKENPMLSNEIKTLEANITAMQSNQKSEPDKTKHKDITLETLNTLVEKITIHKENLMRVIWKDNNICNSSTHKIN